MLMRMREKLPVPSVILVTSGKGGVGKSTIALNLSISLADLGSRVGLLDADVYGPDVPAMIGLTRHAPRQFWPLSGLGTATMPAVSYDGIRVNSIGFLFGEDQDVSWYSGLIEMLLIQLIRATEWGPLDYLVVDTPPGTGDVNQAILRQFPTCTAIVVVTPSRVAHLDAKKVVSMLRKADVPILGGVENLAFLSCPHCGDHIELHPDVPQEATVWSMDVPRLARLPQDLDAQASASVGVPVVRSKPHLEFSRTVVGLAERIRGHAPPGLFGS